MLKDLKAFFYDFYQLKNGEHKQLILNDKSTF